VTDLRLDPVKHSLYIFATAPGVFAVKVLAVLLEIVNGSPIRSCRCIVSLHNPGRWSTKEQRRQLCCTVHIWCLAVTAKMTRSKNNKGAEAKERVGFGSARGFGGCVISRALVGETRIRTPRGRAERTCVRDTA
jgi:hypothetical protein